MLRAERRLSAGVPPARVFLWTCGALIVYLGNIVIRAQSFAYPLFALTLWLVVADSAAPRLRARTWLVLPVLVLWANMHGSVLIGAAMVALYAGYRAVAAVLRRAGPRAVPWDEVESLTTVCGPDGKSILRHMLRTQDGAIRKVYGELPDWVEDATRGAAPHAEFIDLRRQ